jgi:hypothetical protein
MDYQYYDSMGSGEKSAAAGQSQGSYLRPTKPEDWEPYRELIAELYRDKKLKEVMEVMETEHGFKAT